MFKQTKRFLLASVCCLVTLCVAVFFWVSVYMNTKSEDAISEIGMIYMSEMSRQIQQKFDAVIGLHLSQAEGIVRLIGPDEADHQELREKLAQNAEVRGFTYLGLYTKDGRGEHVYGGSVEAVDGNEFQGVLKDEGENVSSGYDQNGDKVLLLTVHAEYPMEDGDRSSFLVVGIPMEELSAALVLEEADSMVYYHIIHKDGTFVIRSGEAYRDNYFTRVEELFREFAGRTPEEYAQELRDAINANVDYSTLAMIEGTHRHLYCSPLPGSEWYLVAVMPYGTLDDAVEHLGEQRQNTMLGACSIILAAVMVIFVLYYRMSQQQLRELNRAEQAAVQANRAKSEFLSNMSHDIRTPMNGIVGMTAIAMADIEDTARVRDCLVKITLSSRHLLGLINDVLDMSKIESGKLSLNLNQVSLHETMDSIVNIIKPQIESRKQHFDIFIQDIKAEEVYCDSVRLNQVLINLLSNAVKFTPEEGTINVYLCQEASPLGDHYVRCHFRVRDSGIGMTPEFQKTIFDTFTREKTAQVNRTEGTGLGMAITKCIVDAMGGTIELWSEPGSGSEFHVILDFEKAVSKIEDMVLPPWRMLVVDNNMDLCLSAVSSLKEIGIDAEWATDGRTAVDLVEKRHQEVRDYEIVLLDWRMPGMDGLQTAKEIRKILGDETPILIISAYDWSDIEKEAAKAGIHGFISKPLFKSNLFVGLRRYMLNEAVDEEQDLKKEETESFAGKRILLAEDNDLNWEIAEEILSEAGFELERAENGRICVEKFTESEEKYYDVILMDIRMPVMSGYDAAVEIRKLGRSDAGLPIIAMTADAFSEDIERCRQCGMNEHVSKPIDVDRLIQLLRKYLK
ncbi:MAG: response regulator [Lachnospiraceae bacterium]|jgi:two-component system sensor histidine kinase/response regulator|nr:response regulator [Lachnospiraceae bacterium]